MVQPRRTWKNDGESRARVRDRIRVSRVWVSRVRVSRVSRVRVSRLGVKVRVNCHLGVRRVEG